MNRSDHYEFISGLVREYEDIILFRRIEDWCDGFKGVRTENPDLQKLLDDRAFLISYYCQEVWDIDYYMEIFALVLTVGRCLAANEEQGRKTLLKHRIEYARDMIHYLKEGAYRDKLVIDTLTEIGKSRSIEKLLNFDKAEKNRLTPASLSLLYGLWYKHNYFVKKRMLNLDGSFYYDDIRLAKELRVDKKTIMRAKRILIELGFMRVKNGQSKGKATQYWMLRKPDKMSPFKELSLDKMSAKDTKMSVIAPQNVTPNKERININNKELNELEREEFHKKLQGLLKQLSSEKKVV